MFDYTKKISLHYIKYYLKNTTCMKNSCWMRESFQYTSGSCKCLNDRKYFRRIYSENTKKRNISSFFHNCHQTAFCSGRHCSRTYVQSSYPTTPSSQTTTHHSYKQWSTLCQLSSDLYL